MVGVNGSVQPPEGINIPVTTGEFPSAVPSTVQERVIASDIRPPAEINLPEATSTIDVPVQAESPADAAMQNALGEINQAATSGRELMEENSLPEPTEVPVKVVGEGTRDAVDASLNSGKFDEMEARVSVGPDEVVAEEPAAVQLPTPPVEAPVPVAEEPAPIADPSAPIPFAGVTPTPPLKFPSQNPSDLPEAGAQSQPAMPPAEPITAAPPAIETATEEVTAPPETMPDQAPEVVATPATKAESLSQYLNKLTLQRDELEKQRVDLTVQTLRTRDSQERLDLEDKLQELTSKVDALSEKIRTSLIYIMVQRGSNLTEKGSNQDAA